MDPKLQRLMALIESRKKSNFPWKRQEPYLQPYYSYSAEHDTWQEVNPSRAEAAKAPPMTDFSILSWNIDFMLPFSDERMTTALAHIKSIVSKTSLPSVVLLQEMLDSDLALIQSQPWIRSTYHLTDLTNKYWESGHYGTCTLIPKVMPITSVFRVHYEATRMERDGLFVDIDVGRGKPLRICNTHLESLVADPPLRPKQVETAARFMHDTAVAGSVLGGDLNAIQPFDRTLHSDNGLDDAYLALGGKEDREEGFTWGQMAQVPLRTRFGYSRMDKLFFCGDLQCQKFERVGLGVEVPQKEVKSALIQEEGLDGGWVTDHVGVRAEFKIIDAAEESSWKI